jgi:hypothetical protein
MIVESPLSNNQRQTNRIHMAMNKPSIKQNGHSNTNENRTDDDYGGGGGGNENGNPDINS